MKNEHRTEHRENTICALYESVGHKSPNSGTTAERNNARTFPKNYRPQTRVNDLGWNVLVIFLSCKTFSKSRDTINYTSGNLGTGILVRINKVQTTQNTRQSVLVDFQHF